MKIAKIKFGDPELGERLKKSFEETGFAIITDLNTLNKYTLVGFYKTCEEFFKDVNQDQQLAAQLQAKDGSQKGYFPFGKEKAKDQEVFDLKEFYHYYSNDQDPTGDSFRSMHRNLFTIGVEVLLELGRVLNLNLFHMVSRNLTLFRILHYPKLEKVGVDTRAVRAAAHEDINLITLLPASNEMGLEVQDINGKWHKVECNPGELVVNVGDMLQELTNGTLRSTTHRVVNADLSKTRFSCPLFIHPHPDTKLSDKYTAGSYLEERLKEIGLKE